MSKSDIYNLTINRNEDILDDGPIIPRCYEVTYIKFSKSMSVNINKDEDKSKNIYRGEGLCGRWCCENNKYMLFFQINITSENNEYDSVKERDKEVRLELPLMLNAIRKIEDKFFKKYKDLDDAEIFIKFNSVYDDFFKVENWGNIKNYINIEAEDEKTTKEKEINSHLIKLQNKINMQYKIILNFISNHIELYLYPRYGKEIKFLINDISILNIDEVKNVNEIDKHYELVASVKIINKIEIEEVLLNIIVKENKVLIKTIV